MTTSQRRGACKGSLQGSRSRPMHPSLDSRTGERGLLLEPGPLLRGGGGEIPEGADDLIGLGEPVLFGLGEDERTVGHDVELATGADEHLGVDAECVLDRGRQTGGLRKIVSNFAVADRHLHDGAMLP